MRLGTVPTRIHPLALHRHRACVSSYLARLPAGTSLPRPSGPLEFRPTSEKVHQSICLSGLLGDTVISSLQNIIPSMLLPVAISAACVWFAYKACRLAFADADLNLLGKGPHQPNAFKNKVVWVTGASQGLGEEFVNYFAACGAKIIISARNTQKLEAIKERLRLTNEVLVLPFDLSAPFEKLEEVAQAADLAFDGAGVHFLIHNAGASQHALAVDTNLEVTQKMFALNTIGPIALTRAILPRMLARDKGRFVVIGSMSSKLASPGQAVYCGCKMGLFGYFWSLATEIAHTNVGVTICCPGPINTGSEEEPRVIYGATGLIKQNKTGSSSGRMAPSRVVHLVANAAAHGVDEAWIAKHPVLLMGYLYQLIPMLGWKVLKKIGPKRAQAVKSGQNGYDVKAMI